MARERGAFGWRMAAVGAGAVVFGFGTLAAIWLLAKLLVLLILGITLAASVAPVVSWLERWLLSLFPEDQGRQVEELLHKMGRAMGGYIRGTVLDGLAVGLLT